MRGQYLSFAMSGSALFLFPLMNYKGYMLKCSAADPMVVRGSRKQHRERKSVEILLETEDFVQAQHVEKPQSRIFE